MIKIIKEGKQEFTLTCRRCGCQYSYELEDIVDRPSLEEGEVKCPCCNEYNLHPDQNKKVGEINTPYEVKWMKLENTNPVLDSNIVNRGNEYDK